MDISSLSSHNPDDLLSASTGLLRAVFDTLSTGIQVLHAIRKKGRIADFEFMIVNQLAKENAGGQELASKTFLSVYNDKKLFETMVDTVERGVSQHTTQSLLINGKKHLFRITCARFGDGILLSQEDMTSEKLMEEKWKIEHRLFKEAQAIGRIGSFERNLPGDKISWSDELYRIHGLEPQSGEITVEKVYSFVHPDDLPELKKTMEGVLKGEPIHLVSRIILSNGELKYVYRRGELISDEQSAPVKIVGTVQDITHQIQLTEQLQKKEEQYSTIVENSPDVITRWDKDLKLIYANPAFEEKTGVSNESLLGKNNKEMGQPPEIAQPWMEKLQQIFDTGEPAVHYNSFPTPKGIAHFYSRLVPEKNAEGDVESILAIARDITELRMAEADLETSRQLMEEDAHFIGQVMDTTPDIIFIMDLNTHQVIYANRPIAEDLGYSKAEIALMKNPILDIMYEEDIPLMMEHLKKMKTVSGIDNILEIEYRIKNKDGSLSWFCDRNSVFRRDRHGIPVEKIGVAQNITKRKVQEQQILTGTDIITQSEEIAGMGSWEYDVLTGNFRWSDGMYRLFNLPKTEKISTEIYWDYTLDEEKITVERIVNSIKNEYKDFEEIITLLPREEEKKIVKIKGVVVKDKKNNPIKVVGVDLDITWQVRAADEITELNKELLNKNRDLETLNSELRVFNRVAAGDYKETIQVLYTNLEYIITKEARVLSDTSKANIRRAQSAIQKMKLLTEDINSYFELYDIGVGKLMIDPNIIVQNLLSGMKEKIEQFVERVELMELPPMPADPLLFSRLLECLIDNAIKFRRLIAPLVIKIKYSLADEMNGVPEALKNTPYTIISVSDNGIGFKDEDAEKIFELFSRLNDKGKYKGAGIGLAVCKKIMAMHDGFITAEGSPATGATINCYFPMKL